MCRAVRCKQCGKTTWAGCGMHVDQVMAGVAESDRCAGHAPGTTASPTGASRGGIFSLFSRR